MSLRFVNVFAEELPYTLREQVLDYARSVEYASPEIFREAKVKPTAELTDQLVLVAGLRKLHAICSSSYWILYNSTTILGGSEASIRVGGTTYSRGGGQFVALASMLNNLEAILASQGLSIETIQLPYSAIVGVLANEPS